MSKFVAIRAAVFVASLKELVVATEG